ncbi:MAG: acetate uptake transporter [Alphaproteobacteria bacterium]
MTQNNAIGNPAAVGLAGFGLSTLLLQMHNIGLIGIEPVIWIGFVFGGAAQMIAGLQEQKTGNNFGYSAFTSYGAFWITLCLILVANKLEFYETSSVDLGWFLGVWGLYTTILFLGAIKIHCAMATTFLTLMLGFYLLAAGHIAQIDALNKIAAIVLIASAFSALYMMAGVILNDIYGRTLIRMGTPWVK